MQAILDFLSSAFSGLFGYIGSALQTVAQWILNLLSYFSTLLWHDLLVVLQTVFLALITVANAAILLLPACNVSTIDLSPFSQTYNQSGSTLSSALCWLLPISFLTQAVLCMVQAVMAYFMISWILRWLKVIK